MLKKTHFFLSGLVILVVILSFIVYFIPIMIIILIIPYIIVILGIPAIYAYLAIISEGNVRKNALMVFIGAFLFVLGNVLDVPIVAKLMADVPLLAEISQILAPPLQIASAIFIRMGFPRKS